MSNVTSAKSDTREGSPTKKVIIPKNSDWRPGSKVSDISGFVTEFTLSRRGERLASRKQEKFTEGDRDSDEETTLGDVAGTRLPYIIILWIQLSVESVHYNPVSHYSHINILDFQI